MVAFQKTTKAIFAFILLSTSVAFGQLLSEDFDYGGSPGDLTTVSGGNWVSHSGTTAVGYQATTLSLANYQHAGAGGAATVTGSNNEDVNRSFTSQSGLVYFSALINISSVSGSTYFFHLKDSGTNFKARVFAQDVGGNLRFGLSSSGSSGTFSTTNFSYNTTYLVVVKYDAATGNADLFVESTVPAAEPMTALLSTTGTGGNVEAVALRQASGSPVAVIDGIRVATDWMTTVPVELQNISVE